MFLDALRDIAASENVPVWGTCPASSLSEEAAGHRPEDVLPGAASLICFGLPLPRGVYEQQDHRLEMVWRSQSVYYRRLDELAIRLAALLERDGYRAVPVFSCMPLAIDGKGDVIGYLNQIKIAERVGIGVIGRNGLLLNKAHGARLLLGGVVTTAILPKTRFPEHEEPGCPADCDICAAACPVKAISFKERRVRTMRCLGYAARTPSMSRLRFVFLKAFRPDSAARLMNMTAFDEHTYHICSRCVTLCPYGGEPR